jgi:hypothetical protein
MPVQVLPASYPPPSPFMYQTQANPHIYNNPTPNNFYQCPPQRMLCSHCDRSIFSYESYAKCTGCVKFCCVTCSQVYYNSNGYFKCEQCSLHSSLIATKWFWAAVGIYSLDSIYFCLFILIVNYISIVITFLRLYISKLNTEISIEL